MYNIDHNTKSGITLHSIHDYNYSFIILYDYIKNICDSDIKSRTFLTTYQKYTHK